MNSAAEPEATDLALVRAAEANLVALRSAEAERLRIALAWAQRHRRTMYDHTETTDPAREREVTRLGGCAFPVDSYCPGELGVALRLHPLAAQALMTDAVDLDARLPHVWAAVQELRLEAWVARKIAAATRDLDAEAAGWVDEQLSGHLGTLSRGRLLDLVEAKVVAADTAADDAKAEQARTRRLVHLTRKSQAGTRNLFARLDAGDAQRLDAILDQLADLLAEHNGDQQIETRDQLRSRSLGLLADPQATLDLLDGRDPRRGKAVVYVHTTPELLAAITGRDIARVEDIGPMTRTMLADFLGHDHITLKPVIDLADDPAADAYEIPAEIAERVHLSKPADIFPWAENTTRRTDLDHTQAWQPHGPPGQTRTSNLAKLIRRHHRIKTHAPGWQVEALPRHRYLWTTPNNRTLLVTRHGTERLLTMDLVVAPDYHAA